MPANLSPDQCAAELARLLKEQAVICEQLRDLSRRQVDLVNNRKEDDLLRLLAEKQKLIDRHESIYTLSKPLREDWEKCRDRASQPARAQAEAAWDNLRTILNEVVELEDASRTTLQSQQDKVGLDIHKIQRGKALHKAYGGATKVPPPSAKYRDQNG